MNGGTSTICTDRMKLWACKCLLRATKPSGVAYPEQLPPIEYPQVSTEGVVAIRRAQGRGEVYYLGKEWGVSKAFRDYYVALKQTDTNGVLDVYFCHHRVSTIDMRSADSIDPSELNAQNV